jgi:hypothetical protein
MFMLRGLSTGLIVGAVTAIVLGLLWAADRLIQIGRDQKDRDYAAAIGDANLDVDRINDEATRAALIQAALRERAIAAYKASLGGKCPLTADEANKLAGIR